MNNEVQENNGVAPERTKACTACHQILPASYFYKAGKYLQGSCKKCQIKASAACVKLRYKNDPVFRRKIQLRESRKYHVKKHTEAYRHKRRMKQLRWRAKFPEKHKARRLVERGIKAGRMVRGSCEKCGTHEQIQAHHDDYSKPLEVRWLCQFHHLELHGKIMEIRSVTNATTHLLVPE